MSLFTIPGTRERTPETTQLRVLHTWKPTSDTVRVLCIGATGQSGSTLLSRLLGALPGFEAVGEVGRIWDKGLIENVTCGCGRPFRDCSFWSRVGDRAFGGWDAVDAAEAARLREALTLKERRLQHPFALPFILHPGAWPSFRADLRRYSELISPVYRPLDEVTGGKIIVDSMKIPAHVYMMSRLPGVRARVAHLVRDPRGYAYSNTRWIERQGAADGEHRAQRSPKASGRKWTWVNLAFGFLASSSTPTASLRYERLVRSPEEELRKVASLMDVALADEAFDFIHERSATPDGPFDFLATTLSSCQRNTSRRAAEAALRAA
jgi:hypothetical protein